MNINQLTSSFGEKLTPKAGGNHHHWKSPRDHKAPYVEVDDKNARVLQLLDLLKEVSDISELDGTELTDRLLRYMKANNMGFDTMKPYLPYYLDRIYRNMYEVGVTATLFCREIDGVKWQIG